MDSRMALLVGSVAAFSATGAIMYFVFPLYIYGIAGNYTSVGIAFSIPLMSYTVSSYAWGRLSDAIRRRKVLLFTAIGFSAFLYLVYPLVNGLWSAIALRTVQSAFIGGQTLYSVMASEYFPERKSWSISRVEMWNNIGGTGGSLLGAAALLGYLPMAAEGYSAVFYLCFALALLSLLFSALVVESYKGGAQEEDGFKEGFSGLKNRRIMQLALTTFLLFTGDYVVLAVFPTYLSHMGLEGYSIALFVAVASSTGIPAAHYSHRIIDRLGPRKTYIIAISLYAIVTCLYASITNFVLLLIVWSLPLWAFFMVSTTTLAALYSPPEHRGSAIGVLRGALALGSFTGATLSGYLVDAIGFRWAFLSAVAFIFMALLAAARSD